MMQRGRFKISYRRDTNWNVTNVNNNNAFNHFQNVDKLLSSNNIKISRLCLKKEDKLKYI